jgi:hypothetical protein
MFFWVVAPCCVVSEYQEKMEAARSSETMVSIHRTTRGNNPESHGFIAVKTSGLASPPTFLIVLASSYSAVIQITGCHVFSIYLLLSEHRNGTFNYFLINITLPWGKVKENQEGWPKSGICLY